MFAVVVEWKSDGILGVADEIRLRDQVEDRLQAAFTQSGTGAVDSGTFTREAARVFCTVYDLDAGLDIIRQTLADLIHPDRFRIACLNEEEGTWQLVYPEEGTDLELS